MIIIQDSFIETSNWFTKEPFNEPVNTTIKSFSSLIVEFRRQIMIYCISEQYSIKIKEKKYISMERPDTTHVSQRETLFGILLGQLLDFRFWFHDFGHSLFTNVQNHLPDNQFFLEMSKRARQYADEDTIITRDWKSRTLIFIQKTKIKFHLWGSDDSDCQHRYSYFETEANRDNRRCPIWYLPVPRQWREVNWTHKHHLNLEKLLTHGKGRKGHLNCAPFPLLKTCLF